MDKEQERLSAELIAKLLECLNGEPISKMNLASAILALTSFYTGALFYLCESANAMALLNEKVIGEEVTGRIREMKRLREKN